MSVAESWRMGCAELRSRRALLSLGMLALSGAAAGCGAGAAGGRPAPPQALDQVPLPSPAQPRTDGKATLVWFSETG